MIPINLLPHREEKRRARKRSFFIGVGVAAIAGLVADDFDFSGIQLRIADAGSVTFTTADGTELDIGCQHQDHLVHVARVAVGQKAIVYVEGVGSELEGRVVRIANDAYEVL